MKDPRRLAVLLVALLALAAGAWLLGDQAPPQTPELQPGEDAPAPPPPSGPGLTAEGPGGTAETPGTPAQGSAGSAGPDTLAAVSGFVFDESGGALPGARVRVLPIDPQSLRGAPYPDGAALGEATCERDGSFRLGAPPKTWLRLIASAPGRATQARRISSAGGQVIFRLPPAARLDVAVLSAEDKPIPAARVHATVGETTLVGSTDADGRFLLDALPPGTARLRISAPGYGAVNAGPFAVDPAQPAEAIVVLPDGIQILGTVRDAQAGGPIAQASVYIAHPGRSDQARPTGADGRYGPLPGGGLGERVFVSVHAPGYAAALEAVVLNTESPQTVDVLLTRAADWSGRVLTAAGQPAAGATVSYTAEGVAGRQPASTTSAADGRFKLPPPPPPAPGRRVVLIAQRGGASAALALRPDSVRPDPLRLTLVQATRVEGRTQDTAGLPLSGVIVRLSPAWELVRNRGRPDAATSRLLAANATGFLGLSTASAPDGRWRLDAVPDGPYRVYFEWPDGSHWRSELLQVTGQMTQAGTEVLGNGSTVAGRVTDATGRAVGGARVRLTEGASVRDVHQRMSGPDGWFEFKGIAAGAHRLRASLGSRSAAEVDIVVDGQGEQRVDLAFDDGAVLEGRVTKGGSPYRGLLTISLRRDGQPRSGRAPHSVRVTDGTFRLTDVRPGRWVVEARAPDGLHARSPLVEVDTARTAAVSLELGALASLVGSVRGQAGKPSAAAVVSLEDTDSGQRLLATADARGQFRFPALAPGHWRLRVSGPGGAPIEERVSLGVGEEHKIELKLDVAGALDVQVVDASGRKVPEVLVLVYANERLLRAGGPLRTNAEGRVDKRDLPVGIVTVRARAADGRLGEQTVGVKAGDTTAVKITVIAPEPR